MKKLGIATIAVACGFLTVATPLSASASTPWPNPVVNGAFTWTIDEGFDSYGSTDTAAVYSSQYYDTGLLEFSDGVNADSTMDYGCVDPVVSPGTVTTDGADTIATCAPFDIPNGSAGAGLTVTPELRILDSLHVARQLFKVENKTGSPITVPTVGMHVQWEYSTPFGLSSSGVRGSGTGDTPIAASDRWVITSDGNTYIPSGVVWAPACQTQGYTVEGADAGDFYANASSAETFAAGSTTYFVTFLQMEIPTAATDVELNAAFDRLGATFDARFATLSDEISVGIPAGSTVRFWNDGSCESPSLPNTGIDMTSVGLMSVLAIVAIVGGLVVIRRRATR